MLFWFVRRALWDLVAWAKFAINKPVKIPSPPAHPNRIETKPLIEAIPELRIRNVMVCPPADIPHDERSFRNTLAYKIQVRLYGTSLSPMQPDLPRIDADPQVALKRAYKGWRRRRFHAPELPAEFLGTPDLGSLAVRSPFACYTKLSDGDGKTWEWNLQDLNNYKHHDGLRKIGSRVLFRINRGQLQAYKIDCELGNNIGPTDERWERACKIALCGASTHLSLVRHFNWVHLAGGAQLAIATRNNFSRNHPLCRLLWPYIYGTQQSNDVVTRGQMVSGGDFETIFSFTHDDMCRLFDDTYLDYNNLINDPAEDGEARGVCNAGFETPMQDNLEQLFKVIHDFVCNYLEIYYPRQPQNTAADVRNDRETLSWLKELNKRVPNRVGVDRANVTWEKLARLLATQLYLVTVQHEVLGSSMWNYQLWTHCQPAQVDQDFRPEPLDVYQRLVNANYILNVHRRALMDNFTRFALDHRGKSAMLQFHADLGKLQARMDAQPHAVWRLYPRNLKVNINA